MLCPVIKRNSGETAPLKAKRREHAAKTNRDPSSVSLFPGIEKLVQGEPNSMFLVCRSTHLEVACKQQQKTQEGGEEANKKLRERQIPGSKQSRRLAVNN